MDSFLSTEECQALADSGLHKKAYFLIKNVSQSIFSVARYYGEAKIQGCDFFYISNTDELIRDDVVKWLAKYRREAKKKTQVKPVQKTKSFLED